MERGILTPDKLKKKNSTKQLLKGRVCIARQHTLFLFCISLLTFYASVTIDSRSFDVGSAVES